MKYKQVELGDVFKRNGKIYKVISTVEDRRVVSCIPVEEPVCEHCGNRFITNDVESSPGFQESIEAVETIKEI